MDRTVAVFFLALASPAVVLFCAFAITGVNGWSWYLAVRRRNLRADLESRIETEAHRYGVNDPLVISRIVANVSQEKLPPKPIVVIINIIGSIFVVLQWWLAWFVTHRK